MNRKEFSEIEELIKQTIEKHPGCSQGDVCTYLAKQYRSYSHVRRSIKRLVEIGVVRDEGSGTAALYITNVIAR
ncbi:hypothetical protein [uncultured Methanospirillum sp.]|uniref:hypothetical protein n=1 Tax=uncultured Methanospirillum sp. TaxID=262503 RepID=UPI0029C6C2C5|nr:hypothetical protein [uncultured Methanospirillum sp.]